MASPVFRGFSRMYSTARASVQNHLRSEVPPLSGQELKMKNNKKGKKANGFGDVIDVLRCIIPGMSMIYMIGVYQRSSRPLPVKESEEDRVQFRNYLLGLGLAPELIDHHFPGARLSSYTRKHDLELTEEEKRAHKVHYRNYLLGLGLRPHQIAEHFPGAVI